MTEPTIDALDILSIDSATILGLLLRAKYGLTEGDLSLLVTLTRRQIDLALEELEQRRLATKVSNNEASQRWEAHTTIHD